MILHYFVEGENERKLIETIKNKYLYSGKIKVMNTIQNKVSKSILRTLERETIVVLVFDTDIEKIDILEEQLRINVARIDEVRGILHTRRHLAASPIFKGIPDFKQTRIAMLRATKVNDLIAILEACRARLSANHEAKG